MLVGQEKERKGREGRSRGREKGKEGRKESITVSKET